MQQIHDIRDFEGYDTVLIHLKADGTGDTRVHVEGSTGNIFHHNTWAETVRDAKTRQADKTHGLKHIIVLMDDGVSYLDEDQKGEEKREPPD